MKKTILAVAVAMACVAVPAYAQFKIPGMGKKSDSTAAAGADAPSGDALVAAFNSSQGQVIAAQLSLAQALLAKDKVVQLMAEEKSLTAGHVDGESLKKVKDYSTSLQNELAERMQAQPELTADQRKAFRGGLLDYIKAVAGARNLMVSAQQYVGSVGANPAAMMGKAKAALWVGKETPGYVKGLAESSRQLIAYAKRNNIEAPANATAALDGL